MRSGVGPSVYLLIQLIKYAISHLFLGRVFFLLRIIVVSWVNVHLVFFFFIPVFLD